MQIHEAGLEVGHEAKLLNALLALIAQLWAQVSIPFQIPTPSNGMSVLAAVERKESPRTEKTTKECTGCKRMESIIVMTMPDRRWSKEKEIVMKSLERRNETFKNQKYAGVRAS